MRRLRLSIAQIMLLVLFIGLAIGALRSPSRLMASTTWTVTAALLCWAIVAAIHWRDHRRAFWLGFAVFGWVHLVVIFALHRSGLSATTVPPLPSLLTDDLIDYLRTHLVPRLIMASGTSYNFLTVTGTFNGTNFAFLEFDQIARLLVTLLVALIGGGLSRLAAGWSSPPAPPATKDIS